MRKTGRAYRRAMNRKKKRAMVECATMFDSYLWRPNFYFAERTDKHGNTKGLVLHRSKSRFTGYVKKMCNRKMRRQDIDFTATPGYYHRASEYWWNIF